MLEEQVGYFLATYEFRNKSLFPEWNFIPELVVYSELCTT
jgi:hypothetical protein